MNPLVILSLALLWLVVGLMSVMLLRLYQLLDRSTKRDGLARQDHGVAMGQAFPVRRLLTVDLTEIQLLHPEKPTILIIVSTSCRACAGLYPVLESFHRAHVGLHLVLAVAGDSNSLDSLIEAIGPTFPVVKVDKTELAAMRNEIVPFAYAIDQGGVVVAKGVINDGSGLEELVRRVGSRKRTA